MPDLMEIISLPFENELHTCPACGYKLGFHTSFVCTGEVRENSVKPSREACRVILICPECGARYDVGWLVSFSGPVSRSANVPDTSSPCVPHGSPAACLPIPPSHDRNTPW